MFMLQIDFACDLYPCIYLFSTDFSLYFSVFFWFSPSRVHLLQNESHLAFSIFVSLRLFGSNISSGTRCEAMRIGQEFLVQRRRTAAVQRQLGDIISTFRHFCISNDRQLSFVDTPLCLFSYFFPPWGQGKRNWFSARANSLLSPPCLWYMVCGYGILYDMVRVCI